MSTHRRRHTFEFEKKREVYRIKAFEQHILRIAPVRLVAFFTLPP